jgi:hypothetical protein
MIAAAFLRKARAAARSTLRSLWYGAKATGLNISPDKLVQSPLDRKVARHYLEPEGSRLLGICDLACVPLTFDLVSFLAVCDLARERSGSHWLDVAIIAQHDDPMPSPRSPNNPVQEKNHRAILRNIAVEGAHLLPSLGNLLLFNSRMEFDSYWRAIGRGRQHFPSAYDPTTPNFLDSEGAPIYGFKQLRIAGRLHTPLAATETDVINARDWLQANVPAGARIVTITLRESPLSPDRNSSRADWAALAAHFSGTGLHFVVVPDFSSIFSGELAASPNVTTCRLAPLSLGFRAALYQEAWMNMMVGTGPAVLCYLNARCNFISARIGIDPGSDAAEMLRSHGLQHGQSFEEGKPLRRLVWEEDRSDVLIRELAAALSAAGPEA